MNRTQLIIWVAAAAVVGGGIGLTIVSVLNADPAPETPTPETTPTVTPDQTPTPEPTRTLPSTECDQMTRHANGSVSIIGENC